MRNWIITLLIFSGFVLGMSAFFINMGQFYGVDIEQTRFVNTTQDVFENTENLQDIINESQGDVSFIGSVYVTGNSVFQFMKLLLFIPTIMGNLLADISSYLALPGWFLPMVIGIVVVIVLFQVISGIGRYRT